MTRACERCGSEIDAASLKKTPSKRFCSMSCKRKAAYRRAVSSHGPAYGPGRKCLECGREVLKTTTAAAPANAGFPLTAARLRAGGGAAGGLRALWQPHASPEAPLPSAAVL